MLEAVIDITPGLSVTLPAQLDFWGKEKTRQSGMLVRIASLAGATPASTLLLKNEDHLIAANRAAT